MRINTLGLTSFFLTGLMASPSLGDMISFRVGDIQQLENSWEWSVSLELSSVGWDGGIGSDLVVGGYQLEFDLNNSVDYPIELDSSTALAAPSELGWVDYQTAGMNAEYMIGAFSLVGSSFMVESEWTPFLELNISAYPGVEMSIDFADVVFMTPSGDYVYSDYESFYGDNSFYLEATIPSPGAIALMGFGAGIFCKRRS